MKSPTRLLPAIVCLLLCAAPRLQAAPGGTSADLAISKTAGISNLVVGQQVSFQLTVTNFGPNIISNSFTVTDFLPAGLQYVSDTGGGAYNPGTGTWTLPPFMGVGNVAFLSITASATGTGQIVNTATINTPAGYSDPNPANNSASATVSVRPVTADLAVSKTVNTNSVKIGDQVSFFITVTNLGPDMVTNATVQDLLPGGLSYVSSGGTGSYNPGTGAWNLNFLAPGNVASLSIFAQANSAGSFTNTASVTFSTATDTNSANNTASAAVTVRPLRADLAVSKTASTNLIKVGDQVSFTVTVTNLGPDIVTNATIQDSLPPGLGYVFSSGPGTYNPGTGGWNLNFLSPGSVASLTISAQGNSPGAYLNTASVTFSTATDTNSANNSAGAAVTVRPVQADLAVNKTASVNSVQTSNQFSYTITVTNLGPDLVTNATVEDVLPAGLTYISSMGAGTYNVMTGGWDIFYLSPGGVASLTITVQANSGGNYTNTATIISSTAQDTNALNNSSTAVVMNSGNPQADLSLTKTASTNAAQIGQQVVFTLVLTNPGPAGITNPIVTTDCLPGGFEYVTDSTYGNTNNGSYSPGTCWWTLSGLAANARATLQITVLATNSGVYTNIATVAVPMGVNDPNLGNNTASCVVTNLSNQADLAISKSASTNSVKIGGQVVFTLVLTNIGPVDVRSTITVTDCLPAGFEYVTDSTVGGTNNNGIYSPGTCWWTLPGLAANASQSLDITVQAITNGVFTNVAVVGVPSGITDPVTNNNTASAVVTNRLPTADLSITKGGSTSATQTGQQVTFTISLQNLGPDDVTNQIVVQDCLPAGLDYVTDSTYGGGGIGTYSPGTCLWTLPNGLAANATVYLYITASGNTNVGSFTNTAYVPVPQGIFDPNTNNNIASVTLTNTRLSRVGGSVRSCTTNGTGLGLVTITLSGPTNAVITTDTNGNYSFTNLLNGSYTITPTLPGTTFAPASANVNVNGNTTVPAFTTGSGLIHGRITFGTNGPGVANIPVKLTGVRNTTQFTDTNGYYVFTNTAAGNYTVTPVATNGYTYYPPTNKSLTLSATNCSGQADFVSKTRTVQLIALEVTQVIQDWNNSVPLTAAKSTFVRAHLQLPPTNNGPVLVQGARLYGTGPGGALPNSPLSPINTNGQLLVTTTNAGDKEFRKFWTNSLDFEIPLSWCSGNVTLQYVWTNNGTTDFRAPPNGGSSNGIVSVAFNQVYVPNIKIYGWNWTNGNRGGDVQNIDATAYADLPGRFTTIYPVPDSTTAALRRSQAAVANLSVPARIPNFLTNKEFTVDNQGDLVMVYSNGKLVQIQANDIAASRKSGAGTNWIYYGAIAGPADGTFGWAGAYVTSSNTFNPNGSLISSGFLPANLYGIVRQTPPHEVGHNLTLPHPTPANYPLFQPISTLANASRPALGPMTNGSNALIFGLDTLTLRTAYVTDNINPIVSPYYYFDLMSYARDFVAAAAPNNAPMERWVSTYTYSVIRSNINKLFVPPPPPPPPAPITNWFFIRGLVDFFNDTAALFPMWTMGATAPPAAPPAGDYYVAVYDTSGHLMEEVPFDLMDFEIEEGDANESTAGMFLVPVQADPAIHEIQVWDGASHVLMADVVGSTNMPSVSGLQMSGTNGSFTGSGPLNLSWQGIDADPNANLTYTVQYSSDGGASWETLDVDNPATSYQIDSSFLDSSTQGMIRVLANDGFNTSDPVLSQSFTIPAHPPSVDIDAPQNGGFYALDSHIFFKASAWDLLDGVLDGASVYWTSSLDGFLGYGDELDFEADALSEGLHTIAVTAMNSNGLTAQASVQIIVLRNPPPQLDIAVADGQVLLTWPSAVTNYNLESTTSLLPTAWSAVTNAPVGMDGLQTVTVPLTGTNTFFRLRMQ